MILVPVRPEDICTCISQVSLQQNLINKCLHKKYTRNHRHMFYVLTFVVLGSLAEKLGLPLPWCCRRRPHDDKVCNRRSTVCLQNVSFLISAREMFLYQAHMFSPLLRILNSGWNSFSPFHNAQSFCIHWIRYSNVIMQGLDLLDWASLTWGTNLCHVLHYHEVLYDFF